MLRSEAMAIRAAIKAATDALPDDVTGDAAALFEPWSGDGVDYKAGDRRRYNGVVYKCLQDHVSQQDWTPDHAMSLWAGAYHPLEDWRQPTGSANAYAFGDKVKHDGKRWISTVKVNVWEPGVYGWDEI